MDTSSDTENTSKSNRIIITYVTNSIEDRHNSYKITHSKNTNDINISEGGDGICVEDTPTTSSEGTPKDAQFINCNANKDLSKILCHNIEHLDQYSRKPNNPVALSRKRSNKHLDITNKSKKIKSSLQRNSNRVGGTSRQKILKKRKQTKQFVAMISMVKNIPKYKHTRYSKTTENVLTHWLTYL